MTFKTYNLKLTEKSYFRLREIELEIEKKEGKTMTKNEIINRIIADYEPK